MKKITSILFAIFLLVSCGENTKIGKYTKEALPENFYYEIVKDESDAVLEKNQLTVEISEKLTEGQIATIAEELYNSKENRRRFYIWYKLKDVENGFAWATSHFDPELEISINGSTTEEDIKKDKLSAKIDGVVIGKWNEDKFSFTNLIIYKKDNKIFIKSIFKDGTFSDLELLERNTEKGTRYDFKDEGGYNGTEYFIQNNDNELELYDFENENFTTAKSIN